MTIIRLSGGVTPGDGADPRSFPAIFNAAADYIENGFRYAGTRYFFSDGSFSKADPLLTGDIGLKAIRVRMVGGGGGGGGAATTGASQSAVGGGGGGGAYAELFIDDISTLSSSETVTRGSGGNGGAAGNNTGSTGGASSFGSALTAAGGLGGAGSVGGTVVTAILTGFGGAGGTAAGGDIAIDGSQGESGLRAQTNAVRSPAGGRSVLSGNLVGKQSANGSDGDAGRLYGGGGGGGANTENDGTARAGGPGGNGLIIVDCFV